jgi:protein-ribulosamine 3-kinase
MADKKFAEFLEVLLAGRLNSPVASLQIQSIGGGSINNTFRLTVNKKQYFFLKLNDAGQYPGLFEREKEGLEFLAQHHCIRTPSVVFTGTWETKQLLILEWIQPGHKTDSFWAKFGQQLAQLHYQSNPSFGFFTDNYMGALPQVNKASDSWPVFFAEARLGAQLELAERKGLLGAHQIGQMQSLCAKLGHFFPDERPSLLHGDLWSGNYIAGESSDPVLVDPAVYYGHRSVDLAMSTLFGGFDPIFYDSYSYHFPLPENYHEQWDICNLYPLLVHLNLFGRSYLPDIVTILNKYS